MASIMTNAAAMTALQTLNSTNRQLETTQGRISTGFRVATAQDNAAYWSIATTMRSDNKALSTVQDALGLGAATVDVAFTALDSAKDLMSEIKSKLVAAREPGVDRGKIQSEVDQLQNQLLSVADAASFSGENWLSVPTGVTEETSKTVVSSFNRANGSVSIGTISISISSTKLFDTDDADGIVDKDRTGAIGGSTFKLSTIDISALTDSAADLDTLTDYITSADDAVSEITDAAADLGAAKSRIDLQKTFVSNLMDVIDRGIGQLVDADMNKESTRLQALQVQQQLGVQALSIANGNSQSILSLFR
jgi:flagellin